jgi:fumarate hydratase class II
LYAFEFKILLINVNLGAARVAKRALNKDISIKKAAEEETDLNSDELETLLDARKMMN